MSSFNNDSNLFLQNLITRLHLRQPNPLLPRSLDAFFNLSSSDDDDDATEHDDNSGGSHKSNLRKEESKLEKQLIRSGDTQTLKPNSGRAVSIGDHHICVGNHVDDGSDYIVWEWHGHIMMFDEEDGYTPEYIYGNYFERLPAKSKGKQEKEVVEEEEKPVNLGLKELIDGLQSGGGRVVYRGLNPSR